MVSLKCLVDDTIKLRETTWSLDTLTWKEGPYAPMMLFDPTMATTCSESNVAPIWMRSQRTQPITARPIHGLSDFQDPSSPF